MSTFDAMIGASTGAWNVAQQAMEAAKNANTNNPAEFSKALLEAQLKISVATSAVQKASSAIDKAYQAHSQVASK